MFWIIYTLVSKTVTAKNVNILGKQASEVRENVDDLCLCSSVYAKVTNQLRPSFTLRKSSSLLVLPRLLKVQSPNKTLHANLIFFSLKIISLTEKPQIEQYLISDQTLYPYSPCFQAQAPKAFRIPPIIKFKEEVTSSLQCCFEKKKRKGLK